jgi:hypothetical protein
MKLYDGVIKANAILKVANEELNLTKLAQFDQQKNGYEIEVL